jgi:hypothetical protein
VVRPNKNKNEDFAKLYYQYTLIFFSWNKIKVEFQNNIKIELEKNLKKIIYDIVRNKMDITSEQARNIEDSFINFIENDIEDVFYELIELIETHDYRKSFQEINKDKLYFKNFIDMFFTFRSGDNANIELYIVNDITSFLTSESSNILFFNNDNVINYLKYIVNIIGQISFTDNYLKKTSIFEIISNYLLYPFEKKIVDDENLNLVLEKNITVIKYIDEINIIIAKNIRKNIRNKIIKFEDTIEQILA